MSADDHFFCAGRHCAIFFAVAGRILLMPTAEKQPVSQQEDKNQQNRFEHGRTPSSVNVTP